MPRYLTNIEFAEVANVSRQAVSTGVQKGIIFKTESGIDTRHPTNISYVESQRDKTRVKTKTAISKGHRRKVARDLSSAETKRELSGKSTKPTKIKRKPVDLSPATPPPDLEYDPSDIGDRKKYEETRHRKIQADRLALDYARELGALVDDATLFRLFGAFWDSLLNDLIYMPDSISDLIVNKVQVSETPVEAVANILKRSLKDAIKQAKRAAREIKRPKSGRKYILMTDSKKPRRKKV